MRQSIETLPSLARPERGHMSHMSRPEAHRLDELSAGYSLAELLSSSACLRFPGCSEFGNRAARKSLQSLQRTAPVPLCCCLSLGVHTTDTRTLTAQLSQACANTPCSGSLDAGEIHTLRVVIRIRAPIFSSRERIAGAGARALELLGFRHHPPRPAPTLPRPILELTEHTSRLSRRTESLSRRRHRLPDLVPRPLVTRQSEHVVHLVFLAPAQQLVAAETRVGSQDELHPRPALPDLSDDALDFLAAAGSRVLVGRAHNTCSPLKMYSGR